MNLWGYQQKESFRGITVELGDKVLAIAGVLHTSPMQAFMTLEPELKQYRKTIVKAIKAFREVLGKYQNTIYAFPNEEEPTARRFLAFTGFEKIDDEVFRWTP